MPRIAVIQIATRERVLLTNTIQSGTCSVEEAKIAAVSSHEHPTAVYKVTRGLLDNRLSRIISE